MICDEFPNSHKFGNSSPYETECSSSNKIKSIKERKTQVSSPLTWSDGEASCESEVCENFFDSECSSSSFSSSAEASEYFKKYEKCGERTQFLSLEREDDEIDDLIIPLDTEDCDSTTINYNSDGEMECKVCLITFKSRIRYLVHARRHFAIDHFRCPVCDKGFIKLSQCQFHEVREHNKNNEGSKESGPRYTFRTRNARKAKGYTDSFDEIEDEDLLWVIPSTCLYPYKGPPVTRIYEPYEIELKYGQSERKSHSRIQAKYAVEQQKRNKSRVENTIRYQEARNKAALERERKSKSSKTTKKPKPPPSKSKPCPEVQIIDLDDSSCSNPRLHPPQLSTSKGCTKTREREKEERRLFESASGPKCYFCSLCGFQSYEEKRIKKHQERTHPEAPLSELLKCLWIEKKGKKGRGKREKAKTDRKKKESHKGKKKIRTKASDGFITRAKKLKEIERQKLAYLLRPRKHVPRVWEVPTPPRDDFYFALGLIPSSDVLLGVRGQHCSVTSSQFRRRRREVSPSNFPSPSVRLVRMEQVESKTLRLCPHCDFKGSSKSEMRAHNGTHGERQRGIKRKIQNNNNSDQKLKLLKYSTTNGRVSPETITAELSDSS